MNIMKLLTLLLWATLFSTAAAAQTEDDADSSSSVPKSGRHRRRDMWMDKTGADVLPLPTRRWYAGNAFDGAIFSTAIFEKPGRTRELTTLRFSLLNIGYHFHYDFGGRFGLFTGIGIKNIGFIEKEGDLTIKRRVYTIGVPLGIKLGNMQKGHYGFIGGGVDFPFNYREKVFVRRKDKQKFNEFFSDRTDYYMPYVFAGVSFGSATTIKVQYYQNNFLNTGYTEIDNGITRKPYSGYKANLLYITLGFDIHYRIHEKKQPEAVETAPEEM